MKAVCGINFADDSAQRNEEKEKLQHLYSPHMDLINRAAKRRWLLVGND